jgi:probable phosphoglycerate mutase
LTPRSGRTTIGQERAAGTIDAEMPQPAKATKPRGAPRAPVRRKADRDGTRPASTRLVLVRHAVTAQTGPLLSGRAAGISLSDDGRRQAEALAQRLAPLPVAAVYASPIERTTETAAAVAARHDLAVQPLPGVLEADYGDWTGQKLSELAKTDLWKVVQRAPSRAHFPGGESLVAMQARMIAALDALVADHPGDLVVVVSHADPIKAAIAHYTGVHLDLFQRIVVSPASVTAFELGQHGVAMVKCNDTGALDELIPPKAERAKKRTKKVAT